MELDFASIKALSSTTRLRMLHELLEDDATPTQLSERVDRSKSTVASHLDVLRDAGLVEKDAVEGRRRVVYRPTSKAKAILQGGERRVRFTVGSVVLSSLLSVGAVYRYLEEQTYQVTREAAEGMGTMTEDSMGGAGGGNATTTAFEGARELTLTEYGLMAAAAIAAGATLAGLVYLGVQLYMRDHDD